MFLPDFARKSPTMSLVARVDETVFLGVFIALNIVRALSIIALLLVFATNILVLVDDIEAVNAFTDGNFNQTAFDLGNMDYVPYASRVTRFRISDDGHLETAPFPTSLAGPFGLS